MAITINTVAAINNTFVQIFIIIRRPLTFSFLLMPFLRLILVCIYGFPQFHLTTILPCPIASWCGLMLPTTIGCQSCCRTQYNPSFGTTMLAFLLGGTFLGYNMGISLFVLYSVNAYMKSVFAGVFEMVVIRRPIAMCIGVLFFQF